MINLAKYMKHHQTTHQNISKGIKACQNIQKPNASRPQLQTFKELPGRCEQNGSDQCHPMPEYDPYMTTISIYQHS
jgi:hypothetical protein